MKKTYCAMCRKDVSVKNDGSFRRHEGESVDSPSEFTICPASGRTPVTAELMNDRRLRTKEKEEEALTFTKSSLIAFLQENLKVRVKSEADDRSDSYPYSSETTCDRTKLTVELLLCDSSIDYDYVYLDTK